MRLLILLTLNPEISIKPACATDYYITLFTVNYIHFLIKPLLPTPFLVEITKERTRQ